MKKQIPKDKLDRIIAKHKELWSVNCVDSKIVVAECHEMASELALDVFPLHWLSITDFINAIVCPSGFCPDATNETIYTALNALGWEVNNKNPCR